MVTSRKRVRGPCALVSPEAVNTGNEATGDYSRRCVADATLLAMDLWATGNHDASEVLCRVADPAQLKTSQVNAMVKGCDNYVLGGSLAGLVAQSSVVAGRADAWRDRTAE